jgi:hypothetical protein
MLSNDLDGIADSLKSRIAMSASINIAHQTLGLQAEHGLRQGDQPCAWR